MAHPALPKLTSFLRFDGPPASSSLNTMNRSTSRFLPSQVYSRSASDQYFDQSAVSLRHRQPLRFPMHKEEALFQHHHQLQRRSGMSMESAPASVTPLGMNKRSWTTVTISPPGMHNVNVKIDGQDNHNNSSSTPILRERTSRYLSEEDRVAIIHRIDNGEKQVTLAKEYQVSRAAICNLYKNREQVLRRVDRNPKLSGKPAKRQKLDLEQEHPMEHLKATFLPPIHLEREHSRSSCGSHSEGMVIDERSSIDSTDTISSSMLTKPGITTASSHFHNASTVSLPILRLVSILRNAELPVATYRRVTERLVRNLIEEAVSCLPQQQIGVVGPLGDRCASVLLIDDTQVLGVSLEDQGLSMLHAFCDVFPTASTTVLSVTPTRECYATQGNIPVVHASQNVFVMDVECATGERACAAIHRLVMQEHIHPERIYFVAVLIARPALECIHHQFPGVTIIVAGIDEVVDDKHRIHPGIGDYRRRFWSMH